MSEQNKIRVLVVGCGNMGAAHAMSYNILDGYEICGLVSWGESKVEVNSKMRSKYELFDNFETALAFP